MITINHNTRPLGFWESACKFGHDFFSGTSNVTARVNVTGIIEPARIQTILKILFLRHPLLRAVIKEKSSDFYFSLSANFADVPFKIFYCAKESDRHHKHVDFYLQIVDEEQAKSFLVEEYLWRIALIMCENSNNHTLVVTFHHSIADGLSAANFFHEFLMLYHDQMTFEKLPLLPSIESMLPSSISWNEFVKNKSLLNDKEKHLFPYQMYAPLPQRKPRNLYQEFSINETRSIIECCKKNEVTITAFLNAVLLVTACQLEDIDDINIALHTPVNLRGNTVEKIEKYHFGCYISMVKTVHEHINKNDNIWMLAKSYKKELT
ncbi:MAG: condensation domain-containing protein, partial [Gammaproteobacteria bacterium]